MTPIIRGTLRPGLALVTSLASILLGFSLLGQIFVVGLIYAGLLPIPIGASPRDLAFMMSHSWGWSSLLIGWTLLAGAGGLLAVGLVRRIPERRQRGTLAGMAARFGRIGLVGALVDASAVAALLAYGWIAYWWL